MEARYSIKRSMSWVGYKVHLTESCDEGFPRLITGVHTTTATATDVKQLASIQDGLAASGVLPAEQLADSSYVCGSNLVASRARHDIDLTGPAYKDNTWQAKASKGFDVAHFRIDWEGKAVSCPQGRRSSIRWSETRTARGRSMIHIDFSPDDCAACPSRPSCTRAKDLPRALTLQPEEEHEAIQRARKRQKTEEFASLYCARAGIEGTFSQGVSSLRATQGSLPRPEEDPPAGVGHRRFDQRLSDNRLAERHPYRCYAALSVGGFGSGELIGAFR